MVGKSYLQQEKEKRYDKRMLGLELHSKLLLVRLLVELLVRGVGRPRRAAILHEQVFMQGSIKSDEGKDATKSDY